MVHGVGVLPWRQLGLSVLGLVIGNINSVWCCLDVVFNSASFEDSLSTLVFFFPPDYFLPRFLLLLSSLSPHGIVESDNVAFL